MIARSSRSTILRKYALSRLPRAKAAKFQLHIRKCERCDRAVELAWTIFRTLRAAESGLQNCEARPEGPALRATASPKRQIALRGRSLVDVQGDQTHDTLDSGRRVAHEQATPFPNRLEDAGRF